MPHPLAARPRIADQLLARWVVGDLPTELAVEEAHTALEIVMRYLLGAGQSVSFPGLVDRAVRHGYCRLTRRSVSSR
jgi:hypothetical protein